MNCCRSVRFPLVQSEQRFEKELNNFEPRLHCNVRWKEPPQSKMMTVQKDQKGTIALLEGKNSWQLAKGQNNPDIHSIRKKPTEDQLQSQS